MVYRCSVIIAVFNGERFLRATLHSILNQTYSDYEIIVINDGSTDRTAMILEEFKDRVRVFETNKIGPGGARNLGISNSEAEYIAFCDADDIWLANKLEKQVEYVDQNPLIAGCYSDCEYIDQNGDYIKNVSSLSKINTNDMYKSLMLGGNFICFSSLLFRRKVLNAVRGFDTKPVLISAEDYDLLIRISKIGDIDRIPSALIRYRKHLSSLSSHNIKNFRATLYAVNKELKTSNLSGKFRKDILINFFNSFGFDFLKERNLKMSRHCIMRSFKEQRLQGVLLKRAALYFWLYMRDIDESSR